MMFRGIGATTVDGSIVTTDSGLKFDLLGCGHQIGILESNLAAESASRQSTRNFAIVGVIGAALIGYLIGKS